ncbi:MAG: CPCC family cysteine-rich protein [Bacillales bacterium]|nr:CPCC family cysteine-rich protein [Bacillales bacterium]
MDFIEILCPVCKEFFFTKPMDKYEEEEYKYGLCCARCGWIYDLEQFKDPLKTKGKNRLNLYEYKKWYKKQLKRHPDFVFINMESIKKEPHLCPVCKEFEFYDLYTFDVCPKCGWKDDGSDELPGVVGVNGISLDEAIKKYQDK